MNLFKIGTSTAPRNPADRISDEDLCAGFIGCMNVGSWLFVGKGLIVG